MATEKKPSLNTIKFAWTKPTAKREAKVNITYIAENGKVIGQNNQGYKDKDAAMQGVYALADLFGILPVSIGTLIAAKELKVVGPGKKPKYVAPTLPLNPDHMSDRTIF